jgi:uncharacterized protein YgbK (DUF1537 family)
MSQNETVSLASILANLPPEPDEASLFPEIEKMVAESGRKLVVIDDDPTGVQTVHHIALLTTWDEKRLAEVLTAEPKLFFLLTNSRSLAVSAAQEINRRTARQLKEAARQSQTDFVVASRSDSTLRGHYPAEILSLESQLGPFDGHLIVPAFFEGGRFTINDAHYVATPNASADTLLRADQTPFAQDKVFGYKTSYLPAWVEEKSNGYWKASQVARLDLHLIRAGGPHAVAQHLQTIDNGRPVIVNAVGYGDLAVAVLGLLLAEKQGKRFLYRTGAAFVRLRGAVPPKPLLTASEIVNPDPAIVNRQSSIVNSPGGLVVVGSYVPGSSAQLENLLKLPNVKGVELAVARVIGSEAEAENAIREAGKQLQAAIAAGQTGVIYTSRQLVTGANDHENLEIGRKVSEALLKALGFVTCPPRFIVAKGGITSHEVAARALGAEQARALGQLLPGVPVWRLERGPNLKFQGVPYVVFPGNVGGPESLADAVQKLSA